MAVLDSIVMKGRIIISLTLLQERTLEQLNINHLGIEKTKITAKESIYWIKINTDIDNTIKNCPTCLEFQATQPKDKLIPHDIPDKPGETVGSDIFMLNSKTYWCITDYYSKFLVVKLMGGLYVDS